MGLDQYGMIGCTTEKRVDDAGKEYTVKIADEDFYWRKHARLQDFMEQLWVEKTGRPAVELNCNDMVLTEGDINKLEGAIHNGYVENVCDGGFFYGHQFQDESVKHYREDDLAFIEAAKAAIKEGKQVVYSCWW
jgi:hypothetical protein|tara:strand:+ start:1498 stop:1899 length:402 start_codon:yes stop_codon:yes gene_type:complete